MLDKRFKRSKKGDKTNRIMNTIDKDLDIRDKWLGIRQLKKEYQPNPYARTNRKGTFIRQDQRAQEAAKYFSKEQWGKRKRKEEDEEERDKIIRTKITRCQNTEGDNEIGEITLQEIKKYC